MKKITVYRVFTNGECECAGLPTNTYVLDKVANHTSRSGGTAGAELLLHDKYVSLTRQPMQPTCQRKMMRRWNGFSPASTSQTKQSSATITLNIPTACPPRTAFPVNARAWFCESISSQHARLAFGQPLTCERLPSEGKRSYITPNIQTPCHPFDIVCRKQGPTLLNQQTCNHI